MPIALLRLPTLVHAEIFQHIDEYSTLFSLSITSTRAKNVIQMVKLPGPKVLRYCLGAPGFIVKGSRSGEDDDMETVVSMKMAWNIPEDVVRWMKLGELSVEYGVSKFTSNLIRPMVSLTYHYLEPRSDDSTITALQTHLNSLWKHQPMIQLKLHHTNSLQRSSVIRNVEQAHIEEGEVNALHIFNLHPKLGNLNASTYLRSPMQKALNLDGLLVKKVDFIPSRELLKYFNGRFLILLETSFSVNNLNDFFVSWIANKSHHNLETLVVHFSYLHEHSLVDKINEYPSFNRDFEKEPRKYVLGTRIMGYDFPPTNNNNRVQLISDIQQREHGKRASIHVGRGVMWFRVYE